MYLCPSLNGLVESVVSVGSSIKVDRKVTTGNLCFIFQILYLPNTGFRSRGRYITFENDDDSRL